MEYDAEKALRVAHEAKIQNLALQAICAALLGELALLHADPAAKLSAMSASLQGVAAGIAEHANEPAITEVIERVCSMAEQAISPPPKNR